MPIIIFLLLLLFYAPLAFVLVLLSFRAYVHTKYKNIDKQLRAIGFVTDYLFRFNSLRAVRKLRKRLSHIIIRPSRKNMYEELIIKDENGKKLRLIMLKSKDTKQKATGLLWIHGGGMALKKPENDTLVMEHFINCSNTVILSPDYTLSLDAPYPAALNDCYTALLYMKNNAEKLGINENQIFVGGASAGGGLAAAITLLARDKGEVNIAFQMPLYPMINHETVPKPGEKVKRTFVWDKKRNLIAYKLYLGKLYGSDNLPDYASPLHAKNLENLPPAYTFIGEEDPFIDDTKQYVKRLEKAGVNVGFDVYKGAYHGFESSAFQADISKTAWENLLNAYLFAVDNYTAKNSL